MLCAISKLCYVSSSTLRVVSKLLGCVSSGAKLEGACEI